MSYTSSGYKSCIHKLAAPNYGELYDRHRKPVDNLHELQMRHGWIYPVLQQQLVERVCLKLRGTAPQTRDKANLTDCKVPSFPKLAKTGSKRDDCDPIHVSITVRCQDYHYRNNNKIITITMPQKLNLRMHDRVSLT